MSEQNRVPPGPGAPTPTPTPRPVAPYPGEVSPADYMENQIPLWQEGDQNEVVKVSDVVKWLQTISGILREAEQAPL